MRIHRRSFAVAVAAAIVLFDGSHANAQTVLGGISTATIAFSPAPGEPLLAPRRRTGVVVGVGVDLGGSDRGVWQLEATLRQGGARQVLRVNDELRLTYVDVPLLLHMDVVQGGNDAAVFFLAGPVASFAVGATYTDDGVAERVLEDINAFDLGLAVGLGVESRRFVVDLRYTWGFRAPFVDGDLQGDFRNRTLAVIAGVRLR